MIRGHYVFFIIMKLKYKCEICGKEYIQYIQKINIEEKDIQIIFQISLVSIVVKIVKRRQAKVFMKEFVN